jgi:hypothetical protein
MSRLAWNFGGGPVIAMRPPRWTNCRVTLGDQAIDRPAADSAKLVRSTTGNAKTGKRSLLVRAPGRVRCTSVLGSPAVSRPELVIEEGFVVRKSARVKK